MAWATADKQDPTMKGGQLLPPLVSQACKEPTHSRSLQKGKTCIVSCLKT